MNVHVSDTANAYDSDRWTYDLTGRDTIGEIGAKIITEGKPGDVFVNRIGDWCMLADWRCVPDIILHSKRNEYYKLSHSICFDEVKEWLEHNDIQIIYLEGQCCLIRFSDDTKRVLFKLRWDF